MSRRAIWTGLSLLCLACGEPEPAVAPSERAAMRAPAPAAPAGADAPRGPSGQPEVRCRGASLDPAELDLVASRADVDLAGTLSALEALAGRSPGSATARVRLGELSLRTSPPRAESAARWLDRALALHAEGCTLGYRDHWAALEGSARARMVQSGYAEALPFLRQSLQRWPTVRSTRYNLACALCQTGDLDGCERELAAVIRERQPMPDFLADQIRTPGHYEALANRDPDLAPLRATADRFARALGGTEN